MSRARPLRRLLVGLLLGVLVLLGMVIAVAAYLTATPQGMRYLLSQAERWLPGELQVEVIEGSLWGQLTLEGLAYRSSGPQLDLQRFYLDWDPAALFSGTLHIRALAVGPLSATLPGEQAPPQETEQESEPLALPDLQLPFQITVDDLALRDITIHRAPADSASVEEPLAEIDQLQLNIHSEGDTLVVERFRVQAPQGSLALQGSVTPRGDFPLQLQSDWRLRLPDREPLSGQGTMGGSLAHLEVVQHLSGLVEAGVVARLQLLQAEPAATVEIKPLGVDLGVAAPALAGRTLTGELTLQAAGETLAVRGNLQAPLPELGPSRLALRATLSREQLTIEQLQLRQQEGKARIQLKGQVEDWLQQPQLALQGQWEQLGYPLQGAPRWRSGEGQFQLSGEPTDYRLTLEAGVSGESLPAGQWRLEAEGNESALRSITLKGQTLEGELALRGRVGWQPVLSWDLALAGEQLNPGVHWPEWSGSLSFQASTRGRLEASGAPSLSVDLETLQGTLRDEPVQGHAQGQFDGRTLRVDEVQIAVAGAELKAGGELGETLDLEWILSVPRFDKLLPDAEGQLAVEGVLRGSPEQPRLTATIEGEKLRWQGRRIAAVSGDMDVDVGGQQPSRLRLEARELDMDGQRWQQLELRGEGTPERHRIEAQLAEGPLELELALEGSWEAPRWQGSLQRLNFQNDLAGQWQLQAPVALNASAAEADVGRLCLEAVPEDEARLCAQGQWSAEQGVRADADVEGVPLQRLDPWLPAGTQAQGALWAKASFSQPAQGRPRARLEARIDAAQLWLPDEDLRLVSETFTLSGLLEEEQARGKLALALQNPPGGLNAEVQVGDLYGKGNLEGQLQARLGDLEFVSLLVPQVRVLSGGLTSSLTLAGDYQNPRWGGQLQLADASADLPALGTRLEEIELVVRDRQDATGLRIEGGLRSGEGRLTLQGQLDPLAGTGQLELAGERFLAMATEDIQAWISPDIKVMLEPESIKLRGELTVPEASIKPPQIDTRVAPSSDVVVVKKQEPASQAAEEGALERSLDARLRLTLGDQVEVEALGFEGRLQGSVLIVDDGRRATRASGTLAVAAGEYRLYGQDLTISRGSLVFSGGPVDNPGLDLRVSRTVEAVTVGARVGGTLREPRLTLFSDPSMPESNILSYLLLGRPPGAGSSPSEQEMLRNAAAALAIFGGNTLAENIQERLSVDELGLEGGDSVDQTSLYIGKYLSPRLYVKYGAGLLEPTSTFFMRYRLGENWSLESQTGTQGSGGDLVYILER